MPIPPDDRSELRLVESLLWDGRLRRVDRHLRRLAASAGRFGHRFDEAEIRQRLAGAVPDAAEGGRRKVRLSLGPAGDPEVDVTRVEPTPEPVRVVLGELRVDPSDELLYHKTNRREDYRAAHRRASEAGFWEVLFRNTRGELTEGSFTNLLVRSGGVWHTPPVACGLLPGVFREELLETRDDVVETILRPDDLRAADEVWVCNSVRGLKRARVTLDGPS